ncbi:MAG: CBS domain-containing protein [Anaerolineaceae bacterium]|nr:CBS domain-containing protein [Anaerolineaceae bacterium]
MTTVKQVLLQKGDEVWQVSPETALCEALKLMNEKKIGALMVCQAEKVLGIFSERDFARTAACDKVLDMNTHVDELMTEEVYYVDPEKSIDDCMALMTEKHIRHLPVMQNGRLAGLISIGDVVKVIMAEKDISIHSLENYIMGRDYNQ